MMGPKRRVVSLIRVSSSQQAKDDRTGIPRQLEDIRLHCRTHNLEVVKEFQLEGISGAYVKHSPRFREMLSMLTQKTIAGVVFSSIDRFFRPKGLSAYEVFGPFESTGKHLFCDLGELNPRDEKDQMKIVLWGQMAGMERTRIRDRMMRGKEFKRLDPSSKTDTLPKGVAFIAGVNGTPGRFEYTEDAGRVREAFGRVLKGDALQSIAEDLKFTSATALRATLKSHWWIGVKATMQRRDYGDDRRTREDGSLADGRKVKRDTPIFTQTNLAQKPLVSPAHFQSVQDVLNRNTKTWTQRKSRQNEFLATGLLFCQCGRKMYHKIESRPGKPSYYICASGWNKKVPCGSAALNAESVDTTITWAVMTYLMDQRFVKQQVRKVMSSDAREQKERVVNQIQKSLAQTERRLGRAVEFSLDHTEYVEKVKTLKAEAAEERLKLAKAQSELAAQLGEKDIVNLAKQLKERFWKFDEWPMEERKTVLAESIERIVMNPDGTATLTVRGGLPLPIQGDGLIHRFLDEMNEDVEERGYADYPLHGAKGGKRMKAEKVRRSEESASSSAKSRIPTGRGSSRQ
jgi:DNA invertase Pin-like site-specific DNA recombinase